MSTGGAIPVCPSFYLGHPSNAASPPDHAPAKEIDLGSQGKQTLVIQNGILIDGSGNPPPSIRP